MLRTHCNLLAIVLLMAAGCAHMAHEEEESDGLEKLPAPVQATAKKFVGQNKIGEMAREMHDGKTVYDVEFSIKGVTYAIDIDESGNIVVRSVDIDGSLLPPAVLDAAKKAHPTGTIGETEIVTEGDKMYYEMEMKVGGETRVMEIGPGGAVMTDTVAPEETAL